MDESNERSFSRWRSQSDQSDSDTPSESVVRRKVREQWILKSSEEHSDDGAGSDEVKEQWISESDEEHSNDNMVRHRVKQTWISESDTGHSEEEGDRTGNGQDVNVEDSSSDEDESGEYSSDGDSSSDVNENVEIVETGVVKQDSRREDTKELQIEASNDSAKTSEVDDHDSSHKEVSKDVSAVIVEDADEIPIVVDSDSVSVEEVSSESETAMNIAKQETSNGHVDPVVAQKRALLVCNLQKLQIQLDKTKSLHGSVNLEMLPDKGQKIHESIKAQEKEIQRLQEELKRMPLMESTEENRNKNEPYSVNSVNLEYVHEADSKHIPDSSYLDLNVPGKLKTSAETKQLGKKAQATLDRELTLTAERLQDFHKSLVARPSENERAEDPRGLKIQLMPHQQHALAWLLWREQQKPAGGVLADDMGLGKTLTIISLILATHADPSTADTSDSDDEWHNPQKVLRQRGGTLVVCPASLLSHWEGEVNNRCKRGVLSVEVYHGSKRENVPKRLARNDIVVTTYNILTREYKTNSVMYKIHWKRVILDEAHIIRNHKSQASQAVCALVAKKRWALTGTPIQNKETDLYSILKFLQCSPFDDIRVWKRWVENKSAAGHQRLATVMKTLMLRRTKQELQAKGGLNSLPTKSIQEIEVKLDPDEQLVYEKILMYSRTLFAQFLAQRAEKHHMVELNTGAFDKPTFLSNPNKVTQFTKAQNQLLSLHADVKAHEILVLLLRLRQVCCHPALIESMLDQEDMKQSGIEDDENLDPKLLTQMNNMSLHGLEEEKEKEEIGVDHRVTANLLISSNPVFDNNRVSSKMRSVLNLIEEILQKDDKLIVVSQWASMLEVVASHLHSIKGATYSKFTGSVPIKNRQDIMDSFNNKNSDPRILLLSLTAGGVGLNLVGGNHLLLIDNHWNPQLETQAQDRIYRFGQTKDVHIYKFFCKDTIEERIKYLQERKLELAQNVLSGEKNIVPSKLTLNDLKSLFGL